LPSPADTHSTIAGDRKGRPYNNVDKMRMTGKSRCHCEAMKWPWQSVLCYTARPAKKIAVK